MIKLPTVPTVCSSYRCPYNSGISAGCICDDAETNNDNFDAHCHEFDYVKIYRILSPSYNKFGDVIPQQWP